MFDKRRREFITLLGMAAASPLAARAQQPAMPVIGYLSARSREDTSHLIAAFQRGLAENDYVDGRNGPSNTASRSANTTSCRRWRTNWCGCR